MNAGDVALACSTLLVQRWVSSGLAAVCVSPGARSTPLALASARTEGLPLHVHLDERSAAFFALGVAKATGRPAAVICTSGTAAVNLMPAVVEASQAGVPLILLTADRPPRLRGTGANQTIDQHALYGTYPRLFLEAPLPAEGDGAAWHEIAVSVWDAATGTPPGPVHLNLPFDEPLVPTGEPVELGASGDAAASRDGSAGPAEADLRALRDLLEQTERGLVVAGPMEDGAPSVAALARAAGWPLLAEPLSNLRGPGALSAGQFVQSMFEPDVVLQVGRAPTARTTQSFVARARSLVVVESPGLPADPAGVAARTIASHPEALTRAALGAAVRGPGEWHATWARADASMRAALDDLLDTIVEPFEPRIARDVAAALPDGATLFVGNSTPVRDLDAFMAPRDGITVRANRGASGIDGTVSTALGIASVGGPVVALIGDLALLHDASGLLWAAKHTRNAVFVVPNNGGGGIFDLVPQAELPEREKLFVTPHSTDLGALAAAAGVQYARAGEAAEVLHALDHAFAHPGCWLIDVPVDRASSLERRAAVRAVAARTTAQA